MTIRVLLADDQNLVRAAFALLVASAPDMEVVGEAGDALLSPGPTARLIERFLRSPAAPPAGGDGPDCLSDRERQVLTLVARGLNNTEIADSLGLSPLTAKTHVSRVMGKLGTRDRAQLVIVAYESGLVTPGTAQRQ
ncbi:response regulator transcription factor [Streptomyces rochei]|uniref:response regulator transcription factor n=1 Tax=Streptomyces rochei TaxID=1928 RepID=UPI00362725BA